MFDIELLKQEMLTGIIRDFQETNLMLVASGILPRRTKEGHSVSWDIEVVPRDIDTFEGRHSPAGTRNPVVINQQSASLIRTFKSKTMQGSLLIYLRRPGSEDRQVVAQDEVTRQLRWLNRLIERQNEFLIARALQGSIAVTVDQIAITIDYNFTVGVNLNLVIGGGNNNVPTAWTDPTADIIADLTKLISSQEEQSGFTPTTVWTSREVIQTIMKNNQVVALFGQTQAAVEAVKSGTISDFMGMRWIGYNGTFKNSVGTITRFIDKRDIIMTPQPDEEWGWMCEGSDAVPTDDKRGIREVVGRYSYSTLVENPASIALFAGEKRLPLIVNPLAVYVTRVTA